MGEGLMSKSLVGETDQLLMGGGGGAEIGDASTGD